MCLGKNIIFPNQFLNYDPVNKIKAGTSLHSSEFSGEDPLRLASEK